MRNNRYGMQNKYSKISYNKEKLSQLSKQTSSRPLKGTNAVSALSPKQLGVRKRKLLTTKSFVIVLN